MKFFCTLNETWRGSEICVNMNIRWAGKKHAKKLTTTSVSPPGAPLFVPASNVSSPHIAYCVQPAASAAELATPALALAAVVAADQWLDKWKGTTKMINGRSGRSIGIKGKFAKLPNNIFIPIPCWLYSNVLFECLTFPTGRDVPTNRCYLFLNLVLLDIQSSDLGVIVVPLLYQSGSLSAVLLVFSLKRETQI